MTKEFFRILCSFVFLFIFFAKMLISIAPLIATHFDSNVVNAVIMQLEIETNSTTSTDQAKDSLTKGEWLSGIFKFNFEQAQPLIAINKYLAMQDFHIEGFYPSVPTPPPNC
ncbi:hypothetical protein [Daejeonella sp. H1SJ63]|uniref:hypothetical protein n=1 Tax=Daejeonella sp. H1SJ63 TaxID=3034145 RepID=UPI0023ED3991|nr:hypothetical protein [Daejeonella sp. H1SJ63]